MKEPRTMRSLFYWSILDILRTQLVIRPLTFQGVSRVVTHVLNHQLCAEWQCETRVRKMYGSASPSLRYESQLVSIMYYGVG